MKRILLPLVAAVVLMVGAGVAMTLASADRPLADEVAPQARRADQDPLENPAIDMEGFLTVSQQAAKHRETRRVSEDEFIRMAGEPGTIILDARSREMYDLLHVKGAINLPFPDIAVESLDRLIPDKNTRILIYCNNNFENEEKAFARKLAPASLNLSTYVSLYTYGYRNVYELGPQKDVSESKLTLVSIGPAEKAATNRHE